MPPSDRSSNDTLQRLGLRTLRAAEFALRIPLLVVVLSVMCCVPGQRQPTAKVRAAFEVTQRKVLWASGQRHVRLGMWARKLGINAQATEQFMLVREVSEAVNTGGDFLLRLQRQYGEKFWRQHLRRIPRKYLVEYGKRARLARQRNRRDKFGLATLARRYKLTETAAKYYERLLRTADGVIVRDKKGRIPLDCGTIPAEFAARFEDDAVEVDGERQVRDGFLADVPDIGKIFTADSAELRVRSVISKSQADELHALLSRALPVLDEAIGGKPTRKLEVFVFAHSAQFRAYVRRAGYGETTAKGLMDPRAFAALVCAETLTPELVRALALHELTHLYDYALSRAVFPAWYAEALAETYGGVGTFSFTGDKLELGGILEAHRIEPLLADGGLIPLRELLTMDHRQLLRAEGVMTDRFYAQTWAWLRYLRLAAGEATAAKLSLWEARCRGAAVGAEVGKPRARNQRESAVLFEAAFAGDLPRLEAGFRVWLSELAGR